MNFYRVIPKAMDFFTQLLKPLFLPSCHLPRTCTIFDTLNPLNVQSGKNYLNENIITLPQTL